MHRRGRRYAHLWFLGTMSPVAVVGTGDAKTTCDANQDGDQAPHRPSDSCQGSHQGQPNGPQQAQREEAGTPAEVLGLCAEVVAVALNPAPHPLARAAHVRRVAPVLRPCDCSERNAPKGTYRASKPLTSSRSGYVATYQMTWPTRSATLTRTTSQPPPCLLARPHVGGRLASACPQLAPAWVAAQRPGSAGSATGPSGTSRYRLLPLVSRRRHEAVQTAAELHGIGHGLQ